MPNNYRSPWADAGSTFAQTGNTVQDVILGLAQQRYRMAQAQAHQRFQQQQLAQQAAQFQQSNAIHQQQANTMQQHYRDQAPLIAAETLLHQNKANQTQLEMDSAGRLGLGQSALLQDPENAALQAIVVEQLMNIAPSHPQNIVEQSMQASQYGNPAMRQILAAGGINNLQHNVPAGATSIGPNGQIAATGGYHLGPGQKQFGPTTGPVGPQMIGPTQSGAPLGMAQPIASGGPPIQSKTDPIQQLLGTLTHLRGLGMDHGEVSTRFEVDPTSGKTNEVPTDPLYQLSTDTISNIVNSLQQAKPSSVINRSTQIAPPPSNTNVAPQPIVISTKDQFDSLPSGAEYLGKDGRKYRKP